MNLARLFLLDFIGKLAYPVSFCRWSCVGLDDRRRRRQQRRENIEYLILLGCRARNGESYKVIFTRFYWEAGLPRIVLQVELCGSRRSSAQKTTT